MKRLIPYAPHCVAQTEAWLSAQSRQGKHLSKMGSVFASFQEGTPTQYQYCIDVDEYFYDPNYARKRMWEAAGWSYVTTMKRQKMHVYRAAQAAMPLAPEARAWQGLIRRRRLENLFLLAVVLVAALLLLGSLEWRFWLIELATTEIWLQLLYLIIIGGLVIWCLHIPGHLKTELQRKEQTAGRSLQRPSEISCSLTLWHSYLFVRLGFVLMLVLYIAAGAWTMSRNLDTLSASLPYVSLAGLEGNGFVYNRTESSRGWLPGAEAINISAYATYDRQLLGMRRYQVYQAGTVIGDREKDGGEAGVQGQEMPAESAEASGFAWLTADYWVLPGNASKLLYSQLQENRRDYERSYGLFRRWKQIDETEKRGRQTETPVDGRFSEVTLIRTGSRGAGAVQRIQVVARLGNSVAALDYYGEKQSEQLMNQLAVVLRQLESQ